MVGNAFAGAGFGVAVGFFQAVGGLGGEEEVVDAEAFVAFPGAAAEVPPGELAAGRVGGAEGVVEAKVREGAQRVAFGWVVADGAFERRWVVDVDGLGGDVEIAADDEGGVAF